MRQSPDRSSYRVGGHTATVASVTLDEIAKILGVRRNARKLRQLFDDVRGGMAGPHTCVHLVHLLLKAEYDRLAISFDADAVGSVVTVFWHAYAKIENAIEVIGDEKRIGKLFNVSGGRRRLADRLTDYPGVHRYLYRTSTGGVRTALDRDALCRTSFDPMAVIDLEAIARRVHGQLRRPLLILRLADAKPKDLRLRSETEHVGHADSRLAA